MMNKVWSIIKGVTAHLFNLTSPNSNEFSKLSGNRGRAPFTSMTELFISCDIRSDFELFTIFGDRLKHQLIIETKRAAQL